MTTIEYTRASCIVADAPTKQFFLELGTQLNPTHEIRIDTLGSTVQMICRLIKVTRPSDVSRITNLLVAMTDPKQGIQYTEWELTNE